MNARSERRVRGGVLLRRVVVDVLAAVQVVGAGHLHPRARPGQQALHARLGTRAAERRRHPVELGVAADGRAVRAELTRLGVVVLDRDVLEVGLVGHDELDDDVQVAGHLGAELLDEGRPGAALEHDQHAVVERGARVGQLERSRAAAPRPRRRPARAGARRRASGRRSPPRTSRPPGRPCRGTARPARDATRRHRARLVKTAPPASPSNASVPGWAAKTSGSNPRRLVNRHASSRLVGTGSAVYVSSAAARFPASQAGSDTVACPISLRSLPSAAGSAGSSRRRTRAAAPW